MSENLLNQIIPFWYKTRWAFEGYTAQPQQGEIACGYFVSTTLQHAGFRLNRYKLAQQKPETEARALQAGKNIETIENLSPQKLRDFFLAGKQDGLYFAGLDFHVGYLLRRKNEVFFIHSNYIGAAGVTIEKILFSEALAASSTCYLADITYNDALVKAWMTGTEIKVPYSR